MELVVMLYITCSFALGIYLGNLGLLIAVAPIVLWILFCIGMEIKMSIEESREERKSSKLKHAADIQTNTDPQGNSYLSPSANARGFLFGSDGELQQIEVAADGKVLYLDQPR